MVCIIRSEPSAVPRPWLGLIVIASDADGGRSGRWGETVLDAAIEAAGPQAAEWAIGVANGNHVLERPGLSVLQVDADTGLAGCILAGLDWTAGRAAETPWLLTIRGDAAPSPPDLSMRLAAAVSGGRADMACVARRGRPDLGYGLWPVGGRRRLRRALRRDGAAAMTAWTASARLATVEFDLNSALNGPAHR